MDKIRIRGGRPLSGSIDIGGAKNAALPLMVAGMLTDQRLVLTRVPRLDDIATMTSLIAQHGVAVERLSNDGRSLSIGGEITSNEAPYDIVRKMRASVLVLGPLVARVGEARVSLPGGCAIGSRPVDLHLRGLEQLGATIRLDAGYVHATAPQGLRGATIVMPFPSVGATENLLMAATLADGQTVLANAAREPEIGDLAACLVAMGARIEGIGTDRLTIEGVARLHGAEHAIIPDRIETGTYACAAAITGGSVLLRGARAAHLGAVVRTLAESGVEVAEAEDGLTVRRLNGLHGTDVMTEPYPGFPTDMQAQFMVPDVRGAGGGDGHRDDLREPLHACPGAEPHGGADQRARRLGDRARRRSPVRRPGDGQRPARLGLAGAGRPGGARRDGGGAGVPPRPRLRGGGAEAGGVRCGHRPGARLAPRRPASPNVHPSPARLPPRPRRGGSAEEGMNEPVRDQGGHDDAGIGPRAVLLGMAGIAAALAAAAGVNALGDARDMPFGRLVPFAHDAAAVVALLAAAWAVRTRRLVARLRDEVRRRAEAEAGAHGSARIDALTGLPNRRALTEQIDAALAGLWPGLGIALLVIDLDGFKMVNDVHGHDGGDRVLCEAAARLRAALSFGTFLARLGGDEFAVLVPCSLQHRATEEAHAVVAALAEEFRIGEIVVSLGASIGVARGPEDSTQTAALLRAADIAMYRAKQAGRGQAQTFHVSMETDIREAAAVKAELRGAVAEGQIVPFYQPIVDLRDDRIVEFEVLARWRHPQRGLLTPDRFIHLVEGVHQATPMLLSLLSQVARDAAQWPAGLRFSINVFPAQLLDARLVEQVVETAGAGGLAAARLCLEVTESALVQEPARVRGVIECARRAGMAIALDDFGTGYSSLYHLRELPFDKLKIDRSFVQGMAAERRQVAYVGAILALAEALGLQVTAEGIETAETARALSGMGCEYGQGFHYARPLLADQVAGLLAARRAPGPVQVQAAA